MKIPNLEELTKKQKILALGALEASVVAIAVIVAITLARLTTPTSAETPSTSEVAAESTETTEEPSAEKPGTSESDSAKEPATPEKDGKNPPESQNEEPTAPEVAPTPNPEPEEQNKSETEKPIAHSGVCPTNFGNLMLINPNFSVSTAWIAVRASQLIDISATYGIQEGNAYNGVPLMDAEAAAHLNDMLTAYTAETGGVMTTRSCFRSRGTSCGRLCYPTGTSDHHTGLTCDLLDDQYGDYLSTDNYASHPDWQWLHANSYKYGFIDRFPYAWAGGPMSQPVNVDENGSTGLYETWHYRYVGIGPATEIATGKYNGGEYDSLEHYLKAIGYINNLLGPADCDY